MSLPKNIQEELKHLNVQFRLIKQSTEKVLGADKITEAEIGELFACFKTYGGTEKVIDDKTVIEDTANITTFFRPDIQSDCLLVRIDDNARYEIISEPEDINYEHMALKFKVRRLKGKFNG